MNNDKLFLSLWKSSNLLRGQIDPSDFKYIILTIIYLKFISDDEINYSASKITVPEGYKWSDIINNIESSEIAKFIDEVLQKLESSNSNLAISLWKKFNSSFNKGVDKLRYIIKLFNNHDFTALISENKDVLGDAYEYFLLQFGEASGKKLGEFYTPKSIVELMTSLLHPQNISSEIIDIYDPTVGTGGMFVHSNKLVKNKLIKFYGQEINKNTYILAVMNLAIRGFDFDLGKEPDDTLINDLHKFKKFDIVISNPPFNLIVNKNNFKSDDSRWKYGFPNENKANYFFLQHMIDKLNSTGRMAVLLDNGSTTSNATKNIREAILKDDLYEAIIQLPSSIFFGTSIPATLFILNKAKKNKNKILFLDATDICTKEGKVNILKKAHINKIIEIYDNYQLNISSSDTFFSKTIDTKIYDNYQLNISSSKSLFSKIVDTKTVIDNNSSLSIKQYLTSNEVQLDPKEEYIRSINNIESVVIGLGEEFKNILELLKESKKQ